MMFTVYWHGCLPNVGVVWKAWGCQCHHCQARMVPGQFWKSWIFQLRFRCLSYLFYEILYITSSFVMMKWKHWACILSDFSGCWSSRLQDLAQRLNDLQVWGDCWPVCAGGSTFWQTGRSLLVPVLPCRHDHICHKNKLVDCELTARHLNLACQWFLPLMFFFSFGDVYDAVDTMLLSWATAGMVVRIFYAKIMQSAPKGLSLIP